MAVDPVLVMISANENAVFVPLAGGEFLERQLTDDPRLAVGDRR